MNRFNVIKQMRRARNRINRVYIRRLSQPMQAPDYSELVPARDYSVLAAGNVS